MLDFEWILKWSSVSADNSPRLRAGEQINVQFLTNFVSNLFADYISLTLQANLKPVCLGVDTKFHIESDRPSI